MLTAHMKVLTAAQMREVDRLTIDGGIPGLILMENAAHRVVEVLDRVYGPLARRRIAVFCGKGNNGGDGLAVARLLHVVHRPAGLYVVLGAPAEEFSGDAAANLRMLQTAGVSFTLEPEAAVFRSDLVVDALLGTGLDGPARGRPLDLIRLINSSFPEAAIVAVDIPSGMQSDRPTPAGEFVRAQHTVTFTAPKICHALAPACDRIGRLHVVPIGSPRSLVEDNPDFRLSLSGPPAFVHLLTPRERESNKGSFGHALIVAGGRGKTGAAALAGLGALRAGAGLVTIASAASALPSIAAYAAELMTEPLPETVTGAVAASALAAFTPDALLARKNVVAAGPGLGTHPETVALVRHLTASLAMPMVLDADALNALGAENIAAPGPRILTPHPGEMARLSGASIAGIQADRVGAARAFATGRGVWLVLKGNRSLIASPKGAVWINPTGSPALAKGGTGDVLTGLIAGLLAQFPSDTLSVLLAAVWLHGRAGELAAQALGDKSVLAGEVLQFLPEAIRECQSF